VLLFLLFLLLKILGVTVSSSSDRVFIHLFLPWSKGGPTKYLVPVIVLFQPRSANNNITFVHQPTNQPTDQPAQPTKVTDWIPTFTILHTFYYILPSFCSCYPALKRKVKGGRVRFATTCGTRSVASSDFLSLPSVIGQQQHISVSFVFLFFFFFFIFFVFFLFRYVSNAGTGTGTGTASGQAGVKKSIVLFFPYRVLYVNLRSESDSGASK